jgi:hypothetical protein
MMKLLSAVILIATLSACSQKSSWPVAEQNEFLELCDQAMSDLYEPAVTSEYCTCVLEHMMEDFPDANMTEDIPDEKFNEYAGYCLPKQ